jgi:urea transporter
MGFAQVMFQPSVVTGVIFLIALAINSPKSAILAFIGSFVGMAIAIAFSFPTSLINIGFFGFNAVLCGIALKDKKLFYPVFAIIISVFLTHIMLNLNITPLTAPFVFATWIALSISE